MIGNDIVDVQFSRETNNWQRKGFLDKVFTAEEQQYIEKSTKPFCLVWRLWSMKESAYKIYIQCGGTPFFNPKAIKCDIHTEQKGVVSIRGYKLNTETVIDTDYIFTKATIGTVKNKQSEIFPFPDTSDSNQSEYIRHRLYQHLGKTKQKSPSNFTLKKTKKNVPEVYYQEEKLKLSLSLTHHGKYGAYSVLI